MTAADARLPVTLIAGFLGAGKTTLLNRLLADPATGPAAVVVNEYGDVGVDARLVVAARDQVVELANGCLCCTLRGDLVATLDALLARRRARWRPARFGRILVEASGLAAPGPVAQTLALVPELARELLLDGTVCVVHAALGRAQLAEHAEAAEQAAFADVFVVNQVDRADAAEVAALEAELASRQPLARRVRAVRGDVPARDVFGSSAARAPWRFAAPPEGAPAAHDARAVVLESEAPLERAALVMWLRFLVERRARPLWRAKGLVALSGEPGAHAVQTVGPFVDVAPHADDAPARSQLVLLGRELDAGELERGWRALAR